MQQFAFQRRCREVNITFINCGGCVQQCYRSQTSNMLMTPTAATICGIQTVSSNSKSLVVEYTFTSSECVFIQITAAAVSSFFCDCVRLWFSLGWLVLLRPRRHYPTLAPPGRLTLHIEKLLNSSFSINLLCLKYLAHFSYIYPTKEPSLHR